MPDEGAPLYLKRVTAIISMCNLWCHLWYYRHLPKLAPWSFRPPKLRPKELLTLHCPRANQHIVSLPGKYRGLNYASLRACIRIEDWRRQ